MNNYLSHCKLINTTALVSLLGLSSLIYSRPATAISLILNSGFENDYDSWTRIGDTSIQETFQGIEPIGGNNQALITNSCPASSLLFQANVLIPKISITFDKTTLMVAIRTERLISPV